MNLSSVLPNPPNNIDVSVTRFFAFAYIEEKAVAIIHACSRMPLPPDAWTPCVTYT